MATRTSTDRIDFKLAKANGTRKVRTLTRADIDDLCQGCKEGGGKFISPTGTVGPSPAATPTPPRRPWSSSPRSKGPATSG